jgi:exopolysaccharide biosynthesis polyprenyl glycosylphosphotransferase
MAGGNLAVTAAGWAKTYSHALRIADLTVIAFALWLSSLVSEIELGSALTGGEFISSVTITYWLMALMVIGLWVVLAEATGSRRVEFFAQGTEEYTRLFNATTLVFIIVAAVSFLTRAEPSRLLLGAWLFSGFVTLLAVRALGRRFLWKMRSFGRMKTTLFLMGTTASNANFVSLFADGSLSSFRVVGSSDIAQVGRTHGDFFSSLLGELASDDGQSDLVVLTEPDMMASPERDELSARLELLSKGFAVWANNTELATARMRLRVEPGSPLIRIRDVQLSALARLYKRTVDIIVSIALLTALSPLLLLIGAAIRLETAGASLFRQTRVGQFGREFTILKFRSMVADAEETRAQLETAVRDAGNDVLFKMKIDPRVTRVGKFLRATSLDELPQLLNVVLGHMSLVGPRPPLPAEVRGYEGLEHRRLAAKPGLTGLWQISGRSDLSWDESVSLDLQYVEQWSPVGDLLILLKTIPAVVRGRGAY